MAAGPFLAVDYFDGRSAQPRPAWMAIEGHELVLRPGGEAFAQSTEAAGKVQAAELRRVDAADVQWPERTAAGVRMASLPGQGSVHGADAAAWDAWAAAWLPQRESWVVRVQQNWRLSLAALGLLVAVLAASYVWGLPWASRAVLALVPQAVDRDIGETAFLQIDRLLLKPSALPADEQSQWRARFANAVQRAHPHGEVPGYELHFRASRIGPNALALPGGTIVVTDELIVLAREAGELADDLVLGVLAHELGHVKHRHGMRHLVSSSVLGLAAGAVLGDYSNVLAALPVLLGQAQYARDAEREADEEARRLLHAAELSPLGMVRFFELVRLHQAEEAQRRCRERQAGKPSGQGAGEDDCSRLPPPAQLGIAISTHPADTERIEAFRRAEKR